MKLSDNFSGMKTFPLKLHIMEMVKQKNLRFVPQYSTAVNVTSLLQNPHNFVCL